MDIPYKQNFQTVKEYKESRDNTICELYRNNMLIGQIAQQLMIERHTVVRTLQKYHLYDISKSKVHLNQQRIDRNNQVYALHKQGLTSRQIAQKLGISKSNVSVILTKFHDVPKGSWESTNRWRKHSLNKRFFSIIDSEDKAYWLGFLYADGCVTEKSIRLDLAAHDQEHIKKFKQALQAYSYPLYYHAAVNSYYVVINSKEMVQDLLSKGCVPRKTFVIQFPDNNIIPDTLIHHFMRGYFDGDGCICTSGNQAAFSIVGTHTFTQKYQQQLMLGIGKTTEVKLQIRANGISSFTLGGNKQVIKVYNYLYHDAHIFLDRKKQKFDTVIS